MSLNKTRFIILDTESTGPDQEKDKPIEIAAVEWKGGESGVLKTWAIDPKMPIKPSASAVHHLTKLDTQGQPSLNDVKDEVMDFVGNSLVVIHNKKFDLSMLPFLPEDQAICSLRMARKTWNRGELNHEGFPLKNHKAQTIRFWLDLRVDTLGLAAHRAAADILVTGHIFQSILDLYLEKGFGNSIEDLIKFESSPIEYKSFPYGSYEGMPFEKIPDSFLNFYLNETKNKNPDLDVLRLMKIEQLRRIHESALIREGLPKPRFC